MTRKVPVVAIVGRTNVGKSSLFNALLRHRVAIVEDEHGVTRDRTYGLAKWDECWFSVIDTGGLFGDEESGFGELVRNQAQLAIEEADVVVCVFDGVAGIHPHDAEVVNALRRAEKPVIWVVNKCEKPLTALQSSEFYALGIDDFVCISAAHALNLRTLVDAIEESTEGVGTVRVPDPVNDPAIRVAILGRPNVGKSSLVNKLLGEERLVASPIAGTTRDSIDVELVRDGQRYRIMDTAGLRKKANVDGLSVERYSNLRALTALAGCDVAVLVLDATQGAPSEQDANIARLAHERGRGLLIVVNKWDAIEKNHESVKDFERAIYEKLKFVRYAPIVFISALTGRRCPSVIENIKEIHTAAQIRIQTADLNRVLERAFTTKPPPVYRGQPIKLFFATQTEIAPPTIVVFVSFPTRINFSYERYLRNSLREEYPFPGNDIKLVFRKRTEKAERARPGVAS